MQKLAETYPQIAEAPNAELRLRWGQIVLKNDYQKDFWKVKAFLQDQVGIPCDSTHVQQNRPPGCPLKLSPTVLQGKQKYTLPLYRAMMGGSAAAQALAQDTFQATSAQLHSNVLNYVQQILTPKGS